MDLDLELWVVYDDQYCAQLLDILEEEYPYLYSIMKIIDARDDPYAMPPDLDAVPTIYITEMSTGRKLKVDSRDRVLAWTEDMGADLEERGAIDERLERSAPSRGKSTSKHGGSRFKSIGSSDRLNYNPESFDYDFAKSNPTQAQAMLTTKVDSKGGGKKDMRRREKEMNRDRKMFDRNLDKRFHRR